MGEREPAKESIQRGELLYLQHPGTAATFSGYGLVTETGRKEHLAGLLMVDRPFPADPAWLQRVEERFGECRLVPMTTGGERGLLCQMYITPESAGHLGHLPGAQSAAIQAALRPLLDAPPAPVLSLDWDPERRLWRSRLGRPNELPPEVKAVFEQNGYGCLAVASSIGIVHVCRAPDADIASFRDAPVSYRWQLAQMPSAPLIHLTFHLFDRPNDPYRFESFLNIAEPDQAQVLADLANQDRLYLAFYDDSLDYRFARVTAHGEQQWQRLDELTALAEAHMASIPAGQYNFDLAKAQYMRLNP
jgi:hypothetical protein